VTLFNFLRQPLQAGLDLMAVHGNNEIRWRREVAVKGGYYEQQTQYPSYRGQQRNRSSGARFDQYSRKHPDEPRNTRCFRQSVVLKVPERAVDLQIRVSAPTTGRNLPIILLSHGHGISNNLSSLNGYDPLANFWAAHGFIVIQPTHLSSKTLSLDPKTPGAPLFWRSRAEDMKSIYVNFHCSYIHTR
jgi:hypothetical protein